MSHYYNTVYFDALEKGIDIPDEDYCPDDGDPRVFDQEKLNAENLLTEEQLDEIFGYHPEIRKAA